MNLGGGLRPHAHAKPWAWHPAECPSVTQVGQRRKCNRIELSECSTVAEAGQCRKCNRIELFECTIVIGLAPRSLSRDGYPDLRSVRVETALQADPSDRTPYLGGTPGRFPGNHPPARIAATVGIFCLPGGGIPPYTQKELGRRHGVGPGKATSHINAFPFLPGQPIVFDRFRDPLSAAPDEGQGFHARHDGGPGVSAALSDGNPPAPVLPGLALLSGGVEDGRSAIEQGRAFLNLGDLDQAVAELTKAIRLAPDDPEGYLLRGQACDQQGETDQALADFNTAAQIDVGQLLTFAQRLLALTTRRDFDGAVADADQSLRIHQRLCRTCFLRAAVYARRGEWTRAAADYSQVLQLDPANGLAFLRRGEASARLGEWAKAVADYTEAIRLDPRNAETINNRGEALLRLGQSDAAIADFTEALRLDPHFTPARTNRADTHFRRGEYDQAITDYNQALHLAPGSAQAYLGRGLARTEKGDYERAFADLNRALTLESGGADSGETRKTVDRLKSAYDQMVAGLNQFKQLCRQAATECGGTRLGVGSAVAPSAPARAIDAPASPARPQESTTLIASIPAEAAPTETVSLALPDPPGLKPSSESDRGTSSHRDSSSDLPEEDRTAQRRRAAARYCRQGRILKQEGDHDRAVAAYSAALSADRGCVEAYLERGLIHRLARRYTEAVADFDAAIELDPTGEAHFRRGVAHAEQNEFDQAFADFDEAIRREPDHAVAYLNRGLTAVAVGEFERAAADADQALRIDPSLTRARFLRGLANGKLGRHELAAGDFDGVLAEEPDNARAHNQRGLAYAAEGNYTAAIVAYSEALRLAPDFDAAFFNLGTACQENGNTDRAITEFTEFIRRRPHHAPAYHHRGLAYLDREEFDSAIADFTNAFQLDPNLTQAYTSCLEATRLKYERASARSVVAPAPRRVADVRPLAVAAPPDSVRPTRPARPTTDDAAPETQSGVATDPTVPNRPSADRTLTHQAPDQAKADLPSGKLQIECPGCGTAGLLDFRNLGKKFRCPECNVWWRTGVTGDLEEAADPSEETPSPAPPAGKAAVGVPTAPKPVKAVKPAPTKGKRRQEESSLGHSVMWLATVARTKTARWMLVGCVLVFVVLIPVLFPSLFPSELRSRGQKVAQAWLAKDAEQIKTFAEPAQAGSVPRWLELNPPPDLTGQPQKPVVNVTVERNDGKTAEVLIQVKAMKANGTPAYYTYRHRWVSRGGIWYVQPAIPPTGLATGKTG